MTWKLQKEPNGVWYARNQEGAQDRKRSLKTKSKREAEKILHLLNEQENRCRYGAPRIDPATVLTVGDIVPEYLKHIEVRLAPSWTHTVRGYINKHFGPLLKKQLNQISKGDIEAWQNRMLRAGLTKATVNRVCSILSCIYTFAIDRELVDLFDRPRIVRLKEERAPIRWFRDDEVRAIFEVAPSIGEDVALFVHLGIQTGLRLREILSLRCVDVDRTNRQIIICGHEDDGFRPKSRQERRVPVHPDLWPWLNKTTTGRYFPPSPRGVEYGHQFRTDFRGPWRVLMQAAAIEIPATPHAMRHTFGTWLARTGCSAFEIQALMGHSSVQVSERYIHIAGGVGLRRAVEALTFTPLLPDPLGRAKSGES